jgi:glycosyltransferase involved in cell wall biosynthesis
LSVNRIRVLHIVAGLDIGHTFGGAERSAIELALALNPNAFDVRVCAFWRCDTPPETEWQRALEAQSISVCFATPSGARRNSSDFWRGARWVADWCRAQPVDIVHAHHEGGALAALWARNRGGTRIAMRTAYVPHDEEWGHGPINALLRHIFTDHVFPVSLNAEVSVSPDHHRQLGLRPHRARQLALIYNARTLQSVPPRLRDQPVIGNVGRLTTQKGQVDLIEALPVVRQHVPDARLLIAGEGELRPSLVGRAAALGIGDQVQLLGQRQDVQDLMKQMAIIAMPSRWEGIPLAFLEAVAAGVPVVASDIPGFREFIVHRQSGWLVPPQDSTALADAMIEALTQPQLALACAQAAQRSILPQFSMDVIAEKYQALYRSILS